MSHKENTGELECSRCGIDEESHRASRGDGRRRGRRGGANPDGVARLDHLSGCCAVREKAIARVDWVCADSRDSSWIRFSL